MADVIKQQEKSKKAQTEQIVSAADKENMVPDNQSDNQSEKSAVELDQIVVDADSESSNKVPVVQENNYEELD